MWDPPPGYSLIDLTGSSHVVPPQSPLRAPQSPMRIGTKASPRSPRPERQRRPAPPVHYKEPEVSASPKRDQRKMRPLRPSNSGMTAVLAIREHAAVLDQSEASSQMRVHGGGGADSGEALESTRGEEIDEHVLAGGLKDAHVCEGEIHATMADRYPQARCLQ